jgi:DNA-binding transcriptional LysR family regulator
MASLFMANLLQGWRQVHDQHGSHFDLPDNLAKSGNTLRDSRTMDRLDAMQVFTRIVELRSFSATARELDVPASTVTEVVKRLEARLGVRLLERTTRHVSATPDGESYYRSCLSILTEVEDAESAFRGAKPKGLLRVDVQGDLARRVLLPGLPRFLERYPGIELYMSEGERFVDLVREGIDCVLRAGALRDSDMVARRVAMLSEVTAASPSYIARYGVPPRWDALRGHRMVGFRSSVTGSVLPLEFIVEGTARHVTLPATFSVSGASSYRDAALLGMGLIQVPRYALQEHFDSGRMVAVLEDTPPSPTPVSLVYPKGRQRSPRVRAFMDWALQEFATWTGQAADRATSAAPRRRIAAHGPGRPWSQLR